MAYLLCRCVQRADYLAVSSAGFGGVSALAHHFRVAVCFLCACAFGASLTFAVEDVVDNVDSDDVQVGAPVLGDADGGTVTLDDIYSLLTADAEALEDLEVAPLADTGGLPFYGSAYIRGTVNGSPAVFLFPNSYRQGYFGLDSSGRLYNVSSNSISGILYIGSTQYQVSASSWTYPNYRLWGSTSSYQTLYFIPSGDTNVPLPSGPTPLHDVSAVLPYVSIFLLGGIFLCIRKS